MSAAIGDATIVNESGTLEVSLAGVLSDAVTDPLTVTAASSVETAATVSAAPDGSSLTEKLKSAIPVWVEDGDAPGHPPDWAQDPAYHGMTGPAVKITVRDNDQPRKERPRRAGVLQVLTPGKSGKNGHPGQF